jgi:hypothetical protein
MVAAALEAVVDADFDALAGELDDDARRVAR